MLFANQFLSRSTVVHLFWKKCGRLCWRLLPVCWRPPIWVMARVTGRGPGPVPVPGPVLGAGRDHVCRTNRWTSGASWPATLPATRTVRTTTTSCPERHRWHSFSTSPEVCGTIWSRSSQERERSWTRPWTDRRRLFTTTCSFPSTIHVSVSVLWLVQWWRAKV